MKKVILIGSNESVAKNDVGLIKNYLQDDFLEVVDIMWEDIVFNISDQGVSLMVNGKEMHTFRPDLVLCFGWYGNGGKSLYRDIAYSLALYLEHNKIEYWNKEMIQQRSISKLSCMVQLAYEGVSIPRTLFCIDKSKLLRQIELPLVVKAPASSRGRNNYLVRDTQSLDRLVSDGEYYLFQELLPNNHDLRVICFGAVPSLVLRRSRTDQETHLNNTSQGADSEWLPLSGVDHELLTLSRKICKIMGREMGGIDLIPNDKSPYGYSCLEVNAIPQLTSGSDVDIKMGALKKALIGE